MKKKTKNSKLDVISYFLTKLFSGILSFASVSLYTYLLEPELYGNYSLIHGIISVIISVFIGWISSSSLRYYSDYKNEKEKFYTNILIDWIIMMLVSFIIIFIISIFSSNIPIKDFLVYVILLLMFNSIYDIFNSILRASKDTIVYFFTVVGQYLITILVFIIMIKVFDMQLKGIFISLVLAYAIITFFLIIYSKTYRYINLRYYSNDIQIRFIRYGIPMIGVWATSWILNYSDRYLIKLFCSSEKVGLYDIGYKLAENSINILITSLSMAMMPILIDKYNKNGVKSAEETHAKFLRYYFIAIIPTVIGLIAIRDSIYGTLINRQYIGGSNTIIFISLSMLFSGFNQMIYKLLQLKEKTNLILVFTMISVVLNIILNIILIPKYGFIIAAVTTLVSNIVSTLIAYFVIKKYFHIIINVPTLLKVSISSLLMFIFIYFTITKNTSILYLIFIIIVAIIIYFVTLLWLGELDEEFNMIRKKLSILSKERISRFYKK